MSAFQRAFSQISCQWQPECEVDDSEEKEIHYRQRVHIAMTPTKHGTLIIPMVPLQFPLPLCQLTNTCENLERV